MGLRVAELERIDDQTDPLRMSEAANSTAEYELPDDLTFEDAIGRLETIVRTLEEDGFKLEEALEAHAEGMALARYCMQRLDAAELKIQNVTLE